MSNDDRQQRMVERILEDENLRGDLEDDAASALVDWASKRAAIAADSTRPDDVVEAQVQAIRQAARAAALSGENEPQRLIAAAEARLAQDVASSPASDTASAAPATAAKPATPPESPALGQQATAAVASQEAQPSPQAQPASVGSASASRPARPTSARPRRKRSRLARFLKRVLGGR